MAVVGQCWAMFLSLAFDLITCAWSFQDFGWSTPKDSWPGGFSNFDPQPPEPFLDEVHFHCDYAPLKSEEECMGPDNGHCRKGSKCYIKNNAETKTPYATCCCNQANTPVDMIERASHNWSCLAKRVASPAQTRGMAPFCDVHCCKRQAA
eukprot:Skav226783  [mRNA]  locus=scaffold8:333963:334512:- [translate_table: standard]